MKQFGIKYIVSLIFTALAVALLVFQFYLFAGLGLLLAFFFNIREIKFYSSIYQFLNFRVQTLLIGYCTDAIIGSGHWFLLLGFIIPFSGIFRLELFRVFKDSKYVGVDVAAAFAMYLIYFISNLKHPKIWEGWALPIFPMLYATFLSMANLFTKGKYMNEEVDNAKNDPVGLKAPEFSLTDTEGRQVSLSDFHGKNHVVLIFVRGDWCPTCHIMIRAYEMNLQKFQEKDVIPIGISPDSNEINKGMMERLGFRNMLLTDPNQEVATKYGVLFKGNNSTTDYTGGIVLPASFLIDKNGILRYVSSPDNAGEFLSPTLIFPVIEQLA